MSMCIVNVAKPKHGKTTLAKGYLGMSERPKFIYDVNNEYKEFGSQAVFPTMDKFLKEAIAKKDTDVLFEEAYIFFSHASATEEIKNALVRRRHTGNLYIFNFHAIHQIPMFILDFTNYLVIGKTNDKPKWMEANYKDTGVLEAFYEVKENPDPFYKVTLNLEADGI